MKNIDIGDTTANADGLVCEVKDSEWKSYLYSNRGGNVIDFIENTFDGNSVIGLLKNIHVSADMRGRGLGNAILEEALDVFIEDEDVDVVILCVDTFEENKFNLIEWYQSKGFVKIPYCTKFLMLRP